MHVESRVVFNVVVHFLFCFYTSFFFTSKKIIISTPTSLLLADIEHPFSYVRETLGEHTDEFFQVLWTEMGMYKYIIFIPLFVHLIFFILFVYPLFLFIHSFITK